MESLCRKTIQVNLVRIPPQLKELTSRIPENSLFIERHGRLLNLVNSNIEEDMVKVLFQFFDPLHHCFTFPDYQLVPTLEEFSQLLRIPILHQLPYNGTEKNQSLKMLLKHYTCNHLTSRGIGKPKVVSRASETSAFTKRHGRLLNLVTSNLMKI